ncbi:MAG: stage 0 sporulation family protein [Firmicutes bacterium]|nr:stage 0 sporulation family protein [Bacillota bacterium]
MVRVVGVKFKSAGKVYYFDPGELKIDIGENVIVETARGMEYGIVNMAEKEVSPSEIVSPLKKIIRIADEKDRKRYEENMCKKERALRLCQEKINKHKLEMKLIDVEYTFDNSKIIFYFTADGRVDFRELVKDLASVFKMRIELRQIGVRDEAKMMGGIGTCGRSLCCHSWLADFEPVSIKMAKVQNLSLNPTKISGICGRLMCCLKYENDVYVELKKGMPDPGERIRTPDGMAVVVDVNILENKIKTRLVLEEGNKERDQQEKLSTEFYHYKKGEIKRLGKGKRKKKQDNDLEELPGELLKEIEDLLKE